MQSKLNRKLSNHTKNEKIECYNSLTLYSLAKVRGQRVALSIHCCICILLMCIASCLPLALVFRNHIHAFRNCSLLYHTTSLQLLEELSVVSDQIHSLDPVLEQDTVDEACKLLMTCLQTVNIM